MKTKNLIRQLQEADPSGELECCVDNHDIHFVHVYPGNYDGCYETLVREPAPDGPNIVGGIVHCSGKKVRLHTMSIEDCLYDKKDFPILIDANDESNREFARALIVRWKDNTRKEHGE